MSKVKEISDTLIKIAYSDKKDRPSIIVDVKEMLNNIYTHEMPDFQFKLISEILDELEKESLTMVEVSDLTESKVAKTRSKKAKISEAVEPIAEKIEVIEPETLVNDKKQRITRLSNLRRGDRFTFPLSQEDKDMGVSNMIYVFDSKSKTTFYYKSGDSEFSTSENREVNLLSNNKPEIINEEIIIEKPKIERKTIVKPEPKKEEDSFSFLDDLDNVF
jgi:hypothetical protein